MLGEDERDNLSDGSKRTYSRSVSWTDRSPTKPNANHRPQAKSTKVRSCLPHLQPLSINRRCAEEWPKAGSDDLGIWPHPQTPKVTVRDAVNSGSNQPKEEFQFKREKLAFFDKECSRIADHIYLGSDAVAKNLLVLKKNGITHVLNCVGFVCPEYFKNDFVYKTLWLQDSPSEDITSILYDVFDYFEDVREQGGRVLVHCCQGISRSTSLVIAYLMWRKGQSFEDAFQYVKAARGVTNPNMGFACQLLQCQKRVHAVPASPNSVLRMYRMAPHSPYAPLHLVPKMISNPRADSLDSRGAFLVHVPSAIYVWMGKFCNSVMFSHARAAAFQVVHYERAKGPVLGIAEGNEPSKFWDAFSQEQLLGEGSENLLKNDDNLPYDNSKILTEVNGEIGTRKVAEYDLDFEIFNQALAGGVVPPFTISDGRSDSETRLPARESGWSRLRKKFANGIMKEFLTFSKLKSDPAHSYLDADSSPQPPICGSPGSFSYLVRSSSNLSSISPTLSPSNSDYSNSLTFSPSSSNWSDLSYLSSQQPSPSSLSSTEPCRIESTSIPGDLFLFHQVSPPSCTLSDTSFNFGEGNACLAFKELSSQISARREINAPSKMLPSADQSSHVLKHLNKSWSFSLNDSDEDLMEDVDKKSENTNSREVLMLDASMASVSQGEADPVSTDQYEYFNITSKDCG